VGNAHRARKAAAIFNRLLNVRDTPNGAREVKPTVHHSDTRRVVAAILKALQAFEKDVCGLTATDIRDDSAHD
jgi:hypothetical protein